MKALGLAQSCCPHPTLWIFTVYPGSDHIVSSTWLPPWSKGGNPPLLLTAMQWLSNWSTVFILPSPPIHFPTPQPSSYSGQSQSDALKTLVLLRYYPAPWLSYLGGKPESLQNMVSTTSLNSSTALLSLCSSHMPGMLWPQDLWTWRCSLLGKLF